MSMGFHELQSCSGADSRQVPGQRLTNVISTIRGRISQTQQQASAQTMNLLYIADLACTA